MAKSKMNISFRDKQLSLVYEEFNEEVDIDRLLKIDYSNLIAELITFPVVLNKLGILLSEAQSILSNAKLKLEVFEATKKEEIRKSLVKKGEKFTINQVDEKIIMDKAWQAHKKALISKQRQLDSINSLYWAAKAKDDKLVKLSLSLQKDDFIDYNFPDNFNEVTIRERKKLIK